MSPPEIGGTVGTPGDAEPAPPGIRLRKTLGAACIVVGSGLVIVASFLEALGGIRIGGIISAQAFGNLAGFVLLLTGALLYIRAVMSHMEHRHRRLEERLLSLLEASERDSGPAPGAPPAAPEAEGAAAAGPAAAQIEQAAPEVENAQRPPEPQPAPAAAGGTATEPSPSPEEKKQQAMAEAPPAPPAQPETAAAAPTATTDCQVCGSELTGGVCRHCITSAAIQGAYQELSRTQELGVSVDEAAGLLASARDSLEEKDYLQAGEYVRSSRYLLEISAKTYFALRSAAEKAESERRKLEESGIDTTELASKLSAVRSAIVGGDYQEAKRLLDEERSTASDMNLPYFQRPAAASAVGRVPDGQRQPRPRVQRPPAQAADRPQAPVKAPLPAAQGPPPAAPSPATEAAMEAPAQDAAPPQPEAPAEPETPVESPPSAAIPAAEGPAPLAEEPARDQPEPLAQAAPLVEPAQAQTVPPTAAEAVEPPQAAAPPAVPAAETQEHSGKAVPKFSSGIAACPGCGRRTMKGWKKCPHCLTALR